MIKQGSPVLTRDGFGEVLRLESDVAGSRDWWVRLNNGIERWYSEKNLTLLVPETSLAKIKAQWQAEALDDLRNELMSDLPDPCRRIQVADAFILRIATLRRQAGGEE